MAEIEAEQRHAMNRRYADQLELKQAELAAEAKRGQWMNFTLILVGICLAAWMVYLEKPLIGVVASAVAPFIALWLQHISRSGRGGA